MSSEAVDNTPAPAPAETTDTQAAGTDTSEPAPVAAPVAANNSKQKHEPNNDGAAAKKGTSEDTSAPVANAGLCSKNVYLNEPKCVSLIGYNYNSDGGMISNSFNGGVSLPPQLYGSSFNGTLYNWDSDNHQPAEAKCSVQRLDGLPNGVTTITWGSDRDDHGLASKTTVEQCTGFGGIRNALDPADLSCGWETGVIYKSEKSKQDTSAYSIMAFIHIYKIVLDENNQPTKLRMWEAVVDDENKSMLYLEQLKNNITAEVIFGDGATFQSLYTQDKYSLEDAMYQVCYIETFFDSTKGVDVATTDKWTAESAVFPYLKGYQLPS